MNKSNPIRDKFIANHKKLKADREPKEEPPKEEIDVDAIRRRAAELLASSEPVENLNPWEQYCKLKKNDAQAAGDYWRANAVAIKACR